MTTYGAAVSAPEETLWRRLARAFDQHQRLVWCGVALIFPSVGVAGYFLVNGDHALTGMATFFAALVAGFAAVTMRQGRAIRVENTRVHRLHRLERVGLLVAEIEHHGLESDQLCYCQRRLKVTLGALQELRDKLPACTVLAEADNEADWQRVVSEANAEIDRALDEFRVYLGHEELGDLH